MKVLGYYMRGPRNITSNKKITSPADMNNFVIRTPQSAMTVAAFEAVGAKPTPMALAEVFTKLTAMGTHRRTGEPAGNDPEQLLL